MSDRTISVVIPSYNNCSGLQRCLAALERQSLSRERFEVVVVDDGSSDSTWDFLQAFSATTPLRLSCLNKQNSGPGAARNLGIHRAQGALIAFTDDDCIPSQDWLRDYFDLLPLADDVAGIGGALKFVPGTYLARFCQAIGQAQNPALISGDAAYLVTANALYKREEILEVGGFDERFFLAGGEDSDLAYRIVARGGRLLTTEGALVWHDAKSLLQLLQTYRRYGAGTRFQAEIGVHPSMDWNLSLIRSLIHERRRELRERRYSEPELSVFAALEGMCHIAFGFGWYSPKFRSQHLQKKASLPAPQLQRRAGRPARPPVFSIVVLYSTRSSLKRAQIQLGRLPGFASFEVLPVRVLAGAGDVARARNQAIAQARGRYVLTLDTNSRLLPSSLARALFILERGPQVGVVCGPVQFGRSSPADSEPGGPARGASNERPPFYGSEVNIPFDPAQLWAANCIGSGAVIRKAMWNALGGYDEQVADEDWDFWLRVVCDNHRIHRLVEPFYEYSLPPGESHVRNHSNAELREYFRKKFHRFLNLSTREPKTLRPSTLVSLGNKAFRWLASRE